MAQGILPFKHESDENQKRKNKPYKQKSFNDQDIFRFR